MNTPRKSIKASGKSPSLPKCSSPEPIARLTDSARRGELVVIVGTGVSMALTNGTIPSLSWKGLIEDGFAHGVKKGKITLAQDEAWKAQLDSSDIDDLLSAAEFMGRKLEAPQGNLYARWLENVFKDVQPINKEMVSAISAIHAAGIPLCTLNYDPLLERVTGLPPINFGEPTKVTAWMRRESAGILHLHGSWDVPSTCILGISDYETTRNHDVRDLIQRSLSSFKQLLFIGCGDTFADPNFSALIKWLREKINTGAHQHYALVCEDEVAARHADSAWHGFVEPISYGESHDNLSTFLLMHFPSLISPSKKKRNTTKAASVNDEHSCLINDYRAFLLRDCGQMTIEGVRADMDTAQRKFDLERLFVPLKVLPCRPDIPANDPDSEQKLLEWQGKKKNPLPFGKIFAKHKQLALLALPGGGKTLLLKRLAVAYADPYRQQASEDQLPKLDLLPVLIRCREWREHIQLPILTLLRNIADITGQIALKGLDSALIPLFKKGRVLLLVDGLDEIHDDASRSIFVDHLEAFLDEYKNTRLIVTSREAGFNLVAPCLSRFCERWNVAPLDEEAITALCNHWQTLMIGDSPEAKIEGHELAQRLLHNGSLRRLAENPLLLTMLLVVKHGAGGRLPPDRVSLYGRAVEVLLDTWNIKGHDALNLKEAIPQLACVAFQLMRAGKQTATEKELLELLEAARDKLPQIRRYAKDTPYEFLKRVELRSSLLLEAGHQLEAGRTVPFYQFRHLTFQEYLAAVAAAEGHYLEYGASDNVLTPLSSCLTSEEWKEVIPMAAVLARKQAEPLMAELVAEGNKLRRKLEARKNFNGKKEWLDYPPRLPAPVARLMQCLVEEAEATPKTLTAALQLLALFSSGCQTGGDWQALCRGPYGDELLHQMWLLYEPMQWPIETKIYFSYGNFMLYRQPPGYWLSIEGQAELQRLLASQIKEEIVRGLFACSGIARKSHDNQFSAEWMPLDKVESLLFHNDPTIWTAAAVAFAVILLNRKQSLRPSPSSTTLDHLLMLWLSSNGDRALEPLSAVFCTFAGLSRQTWEPVLSDTQVQQIHQVHQLTEAKHEGIDSDFLLGACTVIAFYAKNVWTEDELASRLATLKENAAHVFGNSENRDLSIENSLRQMGVAGRKYLASEKPPRKKKKS